MHFNPLHGNLIYKSPINQDIVNQKNRIILFNNEKY